MISKRAFARRVASIHIASNIDYTKVDAIGFSEDNLAEEMASILYNLVTQTPLWRKSEKILVDQYRSEGEGAFIGGNARRIRRKNSLVTRLLSQITNQDISRALDSFYDYDEMKELATNDKLKSLVAPYVDASEVLEEAVNGGESAYSRASSFLKENVLPMVARRYFPQYLASKMPDISKRVTSRDERRREISRQKAQDSGSSAETPVRRGFHPRARVKKFFSANPLASDIEAEIRSRTFSVLDDGELAEMVEEAAKYVDFSVRGSIKARRLRDRVKAEAKSYARDIVGTYLDSADPSMFEGLFPSEIGEETRAEIVRVGRKYLQGMRSRLMTISTLIIEKEVLKGINQLNLSEPLTPEELDDIKKWEAQYRN
jgi:hypothetical protein